MGSDLGDVLLIQQGRLAVQVVPTHGERWLRPELSGVFKLLVGAQAILHIYPVRGRVALVPDVESLFVHLVGKEQRSVSRFLVAECTDLVYLSLHRLRVN